MKAKINKVTIEIVHDDIFSLNVEGIVVVTDPNLGVSSSLVNAAGPSVQMETAQIGWAEVGSVVLTSAGNLSKVKHIIHAVGPRWGEGSERGKLGNATWACMNIAEETQLRSIAMPAISVGALGYPVEACAQIMIARIIDFTFEPSKYLRTMLICLPDTTIFDTFNDEFKRQIEDLRETGEGKVRV